MAKFPPAEPRKTIFQVRYKPQLRFYGLMYDVAQSFEGYAHWITNRLSVTLRDFEQRHNITISHESTSYETDLPKTDTTAKQIGAIVERLPKYVQDGEVRRVGYRQKLFAGVKFGQPELEAILNAKLLNTDFVASLGGEPTDMTIVLIGEIESTSYRITVGPMKRSEVPNFLEFNATQHIDPANIDGTLKDVYAGFPDVALYFDIDCFKIGEAIRLAEVALFAEKAPQLAGTIVDGILRYIFRTEL